MSNWKFGLVDSMQDPSQQVYSDDKIVIIRDKYPKSKFHYLVLPKVNISGIRSLTKDHLDVVKYMDLKGREFINNHDEGIAFWMGYHAVPSLQRLHLHLISDDFKSDKLKTAKHWNSFTTRFFIPSSKILEDLESSGEVHMPSQSSCSDMLKTKLKCHKCDYDSKTMPMLKSHLENVH